MRILHILQADNIENDYRLIKECQTLIELGHEPNILYFHVNNLDRERGTLPNGVPWVRHKLISRLLFDSGRSLLTKLIEQWVRSALYLLKAKPDVVCVHDERFFGLIPILRILKKFGVLRRVLWDQRELPTTFLTKNSFKRRVLKTLLTLCDGVAMANSDRKAIVIDMLKLSRKTSHKIHAFRYYVSY